MEKIRIRYLRDINKIERFNHKNERICQFRIIKHQPMIHLMEVDCLGNDDRRGIGSTGRI